MGRRKILNLETKIFSAVIKMNAKEGISNISTKLLAKKLGISEPVFFSHFITKQGLLNASFDYAWQQIYTYFGVPTSLMEDNFSKGLEIYREKNDVLLKEYPDEILYVFDYLNSCFVDMDHADLLMKDTFDSLKYFFASSDPQLNADDLDILCRQNIHLSLMYLVNIIRKRIVRSERSDALYYTLRHNGYLALLQTNLDAYKGAKSK